MEGSHPTGTLAAHATDEDVALQQEEDALALRTRGLSYREMGKALGVSHKTAENWTKRALKRRLNPLVDEYRAQEDERIMLVMQRLMAIAEGDLVKAPDRIAAYNGVLRAIDQRAKLHGMNAPVKIEGTVVTYTAEDLELRALINEATAARTIEGEVISA